MAKTKEVKKLVPKNKPLPKKAASGAGAAGNAALTAIAGASRGRSKVLCDNVVAIEQLERKKQELNQVIKAHKLTIKQNGFAIQAVNAVLRLRRMDQQERGHFEENVAIVKEGLGEQLTLWDKAAMGETREAPDDDEVEAEPVKRAVPRDPEAVARERAASSSLESSGVH